MSPLERYRLRKRFDSAPDWLTVGGWYFGEPQRDPERPHAHAPVRLFHPTNIAMWVECPHQSVERVLPLPHSRHDAEHPSARVPRERGPATVPLDPSTPRSHSMRARFRLLTAVPNAPWLRVGELYEGELIWPSTAERQVRLFQRGTNESVELPGHVLELVV